MEKEKREVCMPILVSMLGIIFYLMLFEARARYLICFLPVIIMTAALGMKQYYEMLDVKENMHEFIKEYVNDYKLHIIVPNEIENFERFYTELGYCFRYIQSSGKKEKLKKLIEDYQDIYSNLDKISGYLLETVTDTRIPKSAKKEGSINMCKAIEEMIEEATEETAKETAKNFLMNGVSLEVVMKSIPVLTEEEIIAIYEEVCGQK